VVVFDDAALSLIELEQGAGHGGPAAPSTVSDMEAALDRVGTPFLLYARIDPGGYREVLRLSRG
jgi:hypothetical protein